jgi:hypothetical protein
MSDESNVPETGKRQKPLRLPTVQRFHFFIFAALFTKPLQLFAIP